MGLTVKDILHLPIMRDAKIKAGEELLENTMIEWISVIEGPVENFVRKHELVLSTGIGCEDNPVLLEKFVRELIQSGASVLAFATGRFIFTIPDHIIRLAEEQRLIILTLPWEIRFGDIIQEVLQRLNKEEQNEKQQAEQARRELTNLVLQDKGLQEITQCLYRNIQIPSAIADRFQTILVNTRVDSRVLRAFSEQDTDSLRSTMARDILFTEHPLYHYIEEFTYDSQRFYQLGIFNNNKIQGYLLLQPKSETQFTRYSMNVIEHALTACALYFAKENAVEMTEIRLKDNFVLDLAKSYPRLERPVYHRAQLLGYDLTLPYVCIVGKITYQNNGGIAGDNPANSSMQSMNYYLQKEITNAGKLLDRKTLTTFDAGKVIIYVEADQEVYAKAANQFLDVIERRLYALLSGLLVSWGISSVKEGKEAFYKSHEEARTALEIGLQQKNKGERTFFSNTRINRLLLALSHEPEIEQIIKETLQPLTDYDRKRNTDLVDTLLVYNKYKGNVSQTARELNLHRQSLLYRLRKIEALTSLSLVDADDAFLLDLSVRLWALKKNKMTN